MNKQDVDELFKDYKYIYEEFTIHDGATNLLLVYELRKISEYLEALDRKLFKLISDKENTFITNRD